MTLSRIRLSLVFTSVCIVIASVGDLSRQSLVSRTFHAKRRQTATGAYSDIRLRASRANLPMSFEANRGQTDPHVQFLARANGYTVFLTPNEAVFEFVAPVDRRSGERASPDKSVAHEAERTASVDALVRLALRGAKTPRQITGIGPLPGKSNYFRGNDSSRWRTAVPMYGGVRYTEVYRGIDLLYHGDQGQLEYDFIVAPRADPGVIHFDFNGTDEMQVDRAGDLLLRVGRTEIRQHKPVVYQESEHVRSSIEGRYLLLGEHEVGFQLGAYDRDRALIIDPVLAYSTYLGGSMSNGRDAPVTTAGRSTVVDAAGNMYVTGYTSSPDFPTVNPFQAANKGGDAFVAKFSPNGSLMYSTFLSGMVWDPLKCQYCGPGSGGTSIGVDPSGSIYVGGGTTAVDFPVTPGAFLAPDGTANSFVTKLSRDGSALVFSTMVVSNCRTCLATMAIDSAGAVWMTGSISRDGLPTVNPLQPALRGARDAIVIKLNAEGTALLYSTYLGGTGEDDGVGIAVDAFGNVALVGETNSVDFPVVNPVQAAFGGGINDCWVATMNAQGSALVFATFLGGSDSEYCQGIASDADGDTIVTGRTASGDFPTWNALQPDLNGEADAFVTKLNATGALVYSTFLGGSSEDAGGGVAADPNGNAYVTGITLSSDFPAIGSVQAFAGPPGLAGGGDAFVTKLNSLGSAVIYSTYLGGTRQDIGRAIAADAAGIAYVMGVTTSLDFPTRNPVQPSPSVLGNYAFVSKLAETPCAEDITDQVDVLRFPFQPFFFGLFQFQWVIIHSRATVPIGGPVTLVMKDLQNAVFIDSPAITTCYSPTGDPLMVLGGGTDTVFKRNESVLAGLLFFKTHVGPIAYTPRVLSGIPTE